MAACSLTQDLWSNATGADGAMPAESASPAAPGSTAGETDPRGGSRTGTSDGRAAPDAPVVPPVSPGTPDAGDAASDAPFDCALFVDIAQIQPTTCAVVDPISHRVGRLEWRCAGGGARLTLGSLVLEGTVTGGELSLSACREDPVSWLDGHYEVVEVSANIAAKAGAVTFHRATGLACPRVFTDCSATGGVTLRP